MEPNPNLNSNPNQALGEGLSPRRRGSSDVERHMQCAHAICTCYVPVNVASSLCLETHSRVGIGRRSASTLCPSLQSGSMNTARTRVHIPAESLAGCTHVHIPAESLAGCTHVDIPAESLAGCTNVDRVAPWTCGQSSFMDMWTE